MTRKDFDRLLDRCGFVKERVLDGGVRWHRSHDAQHQFCVLDNVRQGDWRLLLAVGIPPEEWPATTPDSSVTGWVEAESPWFPYFTDRERREDSEGDRFDSKERALQRCADWFLDIGLKWLEGPGARSPIAWRTEHNLLVRRRGGRIAG